MEKQRKIPKFLIVVLVVVVLIIGSRIISSVRKNVEEKAKINEKMSMELEWPNNKVSNMIPKLENSKGKIIQETAESLDMIIYGMSKEEFKKYAESVRANGFDIDYMMLENQFTAKNKFGYEIDLYRSDYLNPSEVKINIGLVKEETLEKVDDNKKEAAIESKDENTIDTIVDNVSQTAKEDENSDISNSDGNDSNSGSNNQSSNSE